MAKASLPFWQQQQRISWRSAFLKSAKHIAPWNEPSAKRSCTTSSFSLPHQQHVPGPSGPNSTAITGTSFRKKNDRKLAQRTPLEQFRSSTSLNFLSPDIVHFLSQFVVVPRAESLFSFQPVILVDIISSA